MRNLLLLFTLIFFLPKAAFSDRIHYSVIKINKTIFQDTSYVSDSVNIGYTRLTRSQLTGALSTVTEKQLQQGGAIFIDQSLKGRAAGVQVTQNSGTSGAAASVRIRGVSTIYNTAEPLYVLDGVPLTQPTPNSLNQFLPVLDFIDPNDIASIEILKDAGAAAIYGSRATNGVVLITTKRGQSKINQVTLNSYFGLQEIPKQMPMLNATEYAGLVNEAFQLRGQTPKYTPEQIQTLGEGTNWQDEIFRVAPVQNHQLNYTSGSAAHRFFAGAGYVNQQGVVMQSGLERYNLRLNYDGKIGKKLKLGTSSYLGTIKNQPSDPDIIRFALVAPPVWKMDDSASDYRNPIKKLKENTIAEEGKLFWSNVFAEYQVLSGLFLKLNYGISDLHQEGSLHSIVNSSSNPGFARTISSFADKTTFKEATLNYHKTWQKHFFSLLSSYNLQQTNIKDTDESSFSKDGKAFEINGGSWSEIRQKQVSYLGSLQYSFADRYFLSASIRKDDSPHLSPQQRQTLSPAIAAAWQVLSPTHAGKFIQSLKLRTSYGKTTLAYSPMMGFRTNVTINRDLVPEKTKQVNIGADLALLSNRIQVSADIYRRNTADGIIMHYSYTSGNDRTYFGDNTASLRNQGLEISINSVNLQGPVTWNTSVIFATNNSKITDLGPDTRVFYNTNSLFYLTKGQPITSYYGYKADGIYNNNSNTPNGHYGFPGDINYQDLNTKGDFYDDRTIIGSAEPQFIYSLDNIISFKSFEATIFMQGVQGNEIYHANRTMLENFSTGSLDLPDNSSRKTLNHWSINRTNTDMPRLNYPLNNSQYSDRYVENGSFLRLRNLKLAYNLPHKLTLRNKIVQAQVYISGQNLLTFTKYTGYDPELGSRLPVEQGWDLYNYPIPRTYLAGLKITW